MENLPFTSLLFWDEFHHKIFTLVHLENSTEISIKGHTSGVLGSGCVTYMYYYRVLLGGPLASDWGRDARWCDQESCAKELWSTALGRMVT